MLSKLEELGYVPPLPAEEAMPPTALSVETIREKLQRFARWPSKVVVLDYDASAVISLAPVFEAAAAAAEDNVAVWLIWKNWNQTLPPADRVLHVTLVIFRQTQFQFWDPLEDPGY